MSAGLLIYLLALSDPNIPCIIRACSLLGRTRTVWEGRLGLETPPSGPWGGGVQGPWGELRCMPPSPWEKQRIVTSVPFLTFPLAEGWGGGGVGMVGN